MWNKNQQEDEEWKEEESELTLEELNVLTQLYEEDMAPSQEESDWMLLIEIKKDRQILGSKYFPFQSDYKVEDKCDICNRYFL